MSRQINMLLVQSGVLFLFGHIGKDYASNWVTLRVSL